MMAMADYAKCNLCGGKAFYDANISDPAYCATWDPSEEAPAIGLAVLCATCATTHEAVIRPRGQCHRANGERVARAIVESDGYDWDACSPSQRERYLDNAAAAIAALDCIRQEAREAAAIRGPMFRSVRTPPSAKRREARRAAVTLLGIIDDGEVWRVALNAMFRVLNASDDAEHWTTVSEARSALKAALRAIAEDG